MYTGQSLIIYSVHWPLIGHFYCMIIESFPATAFFNIIGIGIIFVNITIAKMTIAPYVVSFEHNLKYRPYLWY